MIIKCTECGKDISSAAPACPHCGRRRSRSTLAVLLVILIALIIACWLVGYANYNGPPGWQSVQRQAANRQARLSQAMAYLKQIPEVAWCDIEDNNVYIGFYPLPADWRVVLNGAALRGSETINFGFHAWACDGAVEHWRPGQKGYYGEQSARYGRLED